MADATIQARIFKMEPLADPDVRREFGEPFQRGFWRSVFSNQPHVKVAIIRGSLRFAMPCRCRPGAGKIVQAVPMNPGHSPDEEFRGAIQSELLNLFRSETGDAGLGNPHG